MAQTETLAMQDFADFIGGTFHAQQGETAFALELIEATTLAGDAREGGAFSLLWQGPEAPVFPQSIYQVAHAEAGKHTLFLVPVGQTSAGVQYESVFA